MCEDIRFTSNNVEYAHFELPPGTKIRSTRTQEISHCKMIKEASSTLLLAHYLKELPQCFLFFLSPCKVGVDN